MILFGELAVVEVRVSKRKTFLIFREWIRNYKGCKWCGRLDNDHEGLLRNDGEPEEWMMVISPLHNHGKIPNFRKRRKR